MIHLTSFLFFISFLDNILPPIASAGNNLLQPVSANNNLQPPLSAGSSGVSNSSSTSTTVQVGSTWSDNLKAGDLKIDLDNLLSGKANKTNAPALSMNALKVQNPTMTQMNHPLSPQQQMPPPLAIQTTTPTMGNFAAFGAQTTAPGISPVPVLGGGPAFFNKTSPNIPSSQFANFNQMNNLMQPAAATPLPQKGFTSNNNSNNNNNNNNMQSFDFFQ